MPNSRFFAAPASSSQQVEPSYSIAKSTDIKEILNQVQSNDLLILDIDDTIGRVSQMIGLDAWFRFRLEQFSNDGHDFSAALTNAIKIYNLAQLASTRMVPVDPENHIGDLLKSLQESGVTIIGLTARNSALADKTISLLETLGVRFSDWVLKDATFVFSERTIEIKGGIIFTDGRHKGLCFEQTIELGHFQGNLSTFNGVHFVDDSEKNCNHVAESFATLGVSGSVWHYQFAEIHLKFEQSHQEIAALQEKYLMEHRKLLTDDEARTRLGMRV